MKYIFSLQNNKYPLTKMIRTRYSCILSFNKASLLSFLYCKSTKYSYVISYLPQGKMYDRLYRLWIVILTSYCKKKNNNFAIQSSPLSMMRKLFEINSVHELWNMII